MVVPNDLKGKSLEELMAIQEDKNMKKSHHIHQLLEEMIQRKEQAKKAAPTGIRIRIDNAKEKNSPKTDPKEMRMKTIDAFLAKNKINLKPKTPPKVSPKPKASPKPEKSTKTEMPETKTEILTSEKPTFTFSIDLERVTFNRQFFMDAEDALKIGFNHRAGALWFQ